VYQAIVVKGPIVLQIIAMELLHNAQVFLNQIAQINQAAVG
jgi:hypothetical protein